MFGFASSEVCYPPPLGVESWASHGDGKTIIAPVLETKFVFRIPGKLLRQSLNPLTAAKEPLGHLQESFLLKI